MNFEFFSKFNIDGYDVICINCDNKTIEAINNGNIHIMRDTFVLQNSNRWYADVEGIIEQLKDWLLIHSIVNFIYLTPNFKDTLYNLQRQLNEFSYLLKKNQISINNNFTLQAYYYSMFVQPQIFKRIIE